MTSENHASSDIVRYIKEMFNVPLRSLTVIIVDANGKLTMSYMFNELAIEIVTCRTV